MCRNINVCLREAKNSFHKINKLFNLHQLKRQHITEFELIKCMPLYLLKNAKWRVVYVVFEL